jgi:hypothetical protein
VDEDLDTMSHAELIAEAKRLRQGIRLHRDSTNHELCWHHPALWGLLPEKQDPLPTVPEWPVFLQGCIRYRQSLDRQLPDAPRPLDEHRGSKASVVVAVAPLTTDRSVHMQGFTPASPPNTALQATEGPANPT